MSTNSATKIANGKELYNSSTNKLDTTVINDLKTKLFGTTDPATYIKSNGVTEYGSKLLNAKQINQKGGNTANGLVIKVGGLNWMIVSATVQDLQSKKDCVIVTLMLADSYGGGFKFSEQSVQVKGNNMYSSSPLRQNLLKQSYFSKFVSGTFAENFLIQPKYITYQQTQTVGNRGYGSYTNYPNDALKALETDPNKNGAYTNASFTYNGYRYDDWGNDYIWLPGFVEIGSKNVGWEGSNSKGVWALSGNQLANSNGTYWTRAGEHQNYANAILMKADGNVQGTAANSGGSLRPCIHLSLDGAVDPNLVENMPESQTYTYEKDTERRFTSLANYDATKMTITPTDGQNGHTDAGTYTAKIKMNGEYYFMEGNTKKTEKDVTITINKKATRNKVSDIWVKYVKSDDYFDPTNNAITPWFNPETMIMEFETPWDDPTLGYNHVGVYNITVKLKDPVNYYFVGTGNSEDRHITFEILGAAITPTNISMTYDGVDHKYHIFYTADGLTKRDWLISVPATDTSEATYFNESSFTIECKDPISGNYVVIKSDATDESDEAKNIKFKNVGTYIFKIIINNQDIKFAGEPDSVREKEFTFEITPRTINLNTLKIDENGLMLDGTPIEDYLKDAENQALIDQDKAYDTANGTAYAPQFALEYAKNGTNLWTTKVPTVAGIYRCRAYITNEATCNYYLASDGEVEFTKPKIKIAVPYLIDVSLDPSTITTATNKAQYSGDYQFFKMVNSIDHTTLENVTIVSCAGGIIYNRTTGQFKVKYIGDYTITVRLSDNGTNTQWATEDGNQNISKREIKFSITKAELQATIVGDTASSFEAGTRDNIELEVAGVKNNENVRLKVWYTKNGGDKTFIADNAMRKEDDKIIVTVDLATFETGNTYAIFVELDENYSVNKNYTIVNLVNPEVYKFLILKATISSVDIEWQYSNETTGTVTEASKGYDVSGSIGLSPLFKVDYNGKDYTLVINESLLPSCLEVEYYENQTGKDANTYTTLVHLKMKEDVSGVELDSALPLIYSVDWTVEPAYFDLSQIEIPTELEYTGNPQNPEISEGFDWIEVSSREAIDSSAEYMETDIDLSGDGYTIVFYIKSNNPNYIFSNPKGIGSIVINPDGQGANIAKITHKWRITQCTIEVSNSNNAWKMQETTTKDEDGDTATFELPVPTVYEKYYDQLELRYFKASDNTTPIDPQAIIVTNTSVRYNAVVTLKEEYAQNYVLRNILNGNNSASYTFFVGDSRQKITLAFKLKDGTKVEDSQSIMFNEEGIEIIPFCDRFPDLEYSIIYYLQGDTGEIELAEGSLPTEIGVYRVYIEDINNKYNITNNTIFFRIVALELEVESWTTQEGLNPPIATVSAGANVSVDPTWFTVEIYDKRGNQVLGELAYSSTYIAKVVPTSDEYTFKEGTQTEFEFSTEMDSADEFRFIEIPTFDQTEAKLTGNEILFTITNWEGIKKYVDVYYNGSPLSVSGNAIKFTDAGEYVITFRIKEDALVKWGNDTTEDIDITLTISGIIDLPVFDKTEQEWTGSDIEFTITNWDDIKDYVDVLYNDSPLTVTNGVVKFKDVSNDGYGITFRLKDTQNFKWSNETTTDFTQNIKITPATLTVPDGNLDINFTGEEIDVLKELNPDVNWDEIAEVVSGDRKQTNVGDFSLTFKIKDEFASNLKWKNEAGDDISAPAGDITLPWSIKPYEITGEWKTDNSVAVFEPTNAEDANKFETKYFDKDGNEVTKENFIEGETYTAKLILKDDVNTKFATTDSSTFETEKEFTYSPEKTLLDKIVSFAKKNWWWLLLILIALLIIWIIIILIKREKKKEEDPEYKKQKEEKKQKKLEEKKRLEEERKQKEEEAKLKAEEERKQKEEERKRLEEEKKQKEEEEKRLKEEAELKEKEEKEKQEAEAKQKAEEEKQKQEEEAKHKAEEEKLKLEEEKQKLEEEKKAFEEEKNKQADPTSQNEDNASKANASNSDASKDATSLNPQTANATNPNQENFATRPYPQMPPMGAYPYNPYMAQNYGMVYPQGAMPNANPYEPYGYPQNPAMQPTPNYAQNPVAQPNQNNVQNPMAQPNQNNVQNSIPQPNPNNNGMAMPNTAQQNGNIQPANVAATGQIYPTENASNPAASGNAQQQGTQLLQNATQRPMQNAGQQNGNLNPTYAEPNEAIYPTNNISNPAASGNPAYASGEQTQTVAPREVASEPQPTAMPNENSANVASVQPNLGTQQTPFNPTQQNAMPQASENFAQNEILQPNDLSEIANVQVSDIEDMGAVKRKTTTSTLSNNNIPIDETLSANRFANNASQPNTQTYSQPSDLQTEPNFANTMGNPNNNAFASQPNNLQPEPSFANTMRNPNNNTFASQNNANYPNFEPNAPYSSPANASQPSTPTHAQPNTLQNRNASINRQPSGKVSMTNNEPATRTVNAQRTTSGNSDLRKLQRLNEERRASDLLRERQKLMELREKRKALEQNKAQIDRKIASKLQNPNNNS